MIKINASPRLSHAPVSLVINGSVLKVLRSTGHFEMTRKWRGMSKVKFIVYDVSLDDGSRYKTRLDISNLKWEVERVS